MKFKTTKKAVMSGYANIICVGYCDLQYMLHYENEIAYTTRPEGWGADIYQFGNTNIVTGYAPFGNIRPGYDLNKKYNDQAMTIRTNYSMSWEEQKRQLEKLIEEYIREVTQ